MLYLYININSVENTSEEISYVTKVSILSLWSSTSLEVIYFKHRWFIKAIREIVSWFGRVFRFDWS